MKDSSSSTISRLTVSAQRTSKISSSIQVWKNNTPTAAPAVITPRILFIYNHRRIVTQMWFWKTAKEIKLLCVSAPSEQITVNIYNWEANAWKMALHHISFWRQSISEQPVTFLCCSLCLGGAVLDSVTEFIQMSWFVAGCVRGFAVQRCWL